MNNTTNNKKDNTKKTKRRAYESLLLLLLTISLFITATFAWFTDSAFSKGNKVFAGNLYIDILADAEDLEAKYNSAFEDWKKEPDNGTKTIQNYLEEVLGCEPYSRTYPDSETGETVTERYYITTGTDAGGINLYNMEPGQVRKLDVKYVNTGDLAFKAGGALKFDYDTNGNLKSYTGLETLNKQKEKQAEIYRNNYAVGNGASTDPTNKNVFASNSIDTSYAIADDVTAYISIRLIFEREEDVDNISLKNISSLPIYKIVIVDSTNIDANYINDFKKTYEGKTLSSVPTTTPSVPKSGASIDDIMNYLFSNAMYSVYYGSILPQNKSFDSDDLANVSAETMEIPAPPVSNTIDPKLIAEGKDTSDNDYSYYSAPMNGFDDDKEYEYRFKKLVNLQAEKDEYGNPKKYSSSNFDGEVPSDCVTLDNTTYYKDKGGHLEEVLEVYVIPSANKTKSKVPAQKIDGGTIEEVQELLPKADTVDKKGDISTIDHEIFTNKDNPLHDVYYFGNLDQFTFLMDNGAIADKDYDYKAYALDDTENEDLITLQDLKDKESASETLTIEEQYMLKHNSIEANLYEDYQRYLGNVGGYCLPKDAVTKDDGTVTLPYKDGVDVLVYDEEGNSEHYRYSEMGECEIYLYMPTTADSRYQNASISLSIGATATQVEYEMDDTGYMLYDKFGKSNNNNLFSKGDLISIPLQGEGLDGKYAYLRILDVDDNNAKVLYYDNSNEVPFYENADEGNDVYVGSGFKAVKYNGSDLQKFINGDFSKTIIKNFGIDTSALVKNNINQDVYSQDAVVKLRGNLSDSNKTYSITDNGKNKTFVYCGSVDETVKDYFRPISLSDIFSFYGDDVRSLTTNQIADVFNGLVNTKESGSMHIYNCWMLDALADGIGILSIDSTGNINPVPIINGDFSINEQSNSLDIGVTSNVAVVFNTDTTKINNYEIIEHWQEGEEPTDENDDKVFNVYSWNDEYWGILKLIFKDGICDDSNHTISNINNNMTLKYSIIPNNGDAYINGVMQKVASFNDDEVEDRIDMFLLEELDTRKYIDNDYILAIDQNKVNVSKMYDYTKKVGSDSKHTLKGITWHICPSVITYRYDYASEIANNSDNDQIVKILFNDLTTIDSTAKGLAKDKGYYLYSSPYFTYDMYYAKGEQCWVDVANNTFTLPSGIREWYDTSINDKTNGYVLLDDGNFCNAWSYAINDTYKDDGKVLAEYVPYWYTIFSGAGLPVLNDSAHYRIGICKAPYSYFWGGSWVYGIKDSKNTDLIYYIMNQLVSNDEISEKIYQNSYLNTVIPNNTSYVSTKIIDSSNADVFAEGSKPIKAYHEAASSINYFVTNQYEIEMKDIAIEAIRNSDVKNVSEFYNYCYARFQQRHEDIGLTQKPLAK